MKKPNSAMLLIAIVIGGLIFVSYFHSAQGQTYTEVSGIVTSNTTWTKANSPYRLTGPVAINEDVTLTIEPGVQVYFASRYIQVNGTLTAKGSTSEPISFIDGEIQLLPSSTDWNEKTGVGSILENVNIPTYTSKITIDDSSPKITSSDFILSDLFVRSGSPDISNNKITISSGAGSGFVIESGSPLISYNNIGGIIAVKDGSPVIFNNKWYNSPVCIEVSGGNPYISHNIIVASRIGISASNGIIERNSIHCSAVGIEIGTGTIRNNTIGAVIGIQVRANCQPTISYNNFEYGDAAGKQNIALIENASQDVDVSNNWWGTTNTIIIERNIFDYYDDFSLGKANYSPFLTAENPQAMPDPNAPTPTPINTLNLTALQILIIAVLVVAGVLVGLVLVNRRRKKP